MINNNNTDAFLFDALTNKQSIDWPFVNLNGQTQQSVVSLLNSPDSGNGLNSDFLTGLEKTFNAPQGYLGQAHNPYGMPSYGGGYPGNNYGFPLTYGQPYGGMG